MNEDIIRSAKEHEVVIPEGSINAVSKSGMVNMTSIEPEHREPIVQENTVTNRRISIDDDTPDHFTPESVPSQEPVSNKNALLDAESANGHSVTLATERVADQGRVLATPKETALTDPALVSTEVSAALVEHEPDSEPHFGETEVQDHFEAVVNDPHAQVVASLADKWNEDYEGRVVKLREEVTELNQRLDRLEK
jgi:hypothetical protein